MRFVTPRVHVDFDSPATHRHLIHKGQHINVLWHVSLKRPRTLKSPLCPAPRNRSWRTPASRGFGGALMSESNGSPTRSSAQVQSKGTTSRKCPLYRGNDMSLD